MTVIPNEDLRVNRSTIALAVEMTVRESDRQRLAAIGAEADAIRHGLMEAHLRDAKTQFLEGSAAFKTYRTLATQLDKIGAEARDAAERRLSAHGEYERALADDSSDVATIFAAKSNADGSASTLEAAVADLEKRVEASRRTAETEIRAALYLATRTAAAEALKMLREEVATLADALRPHLGRLLALDALRHDGLPDGGFGAASGLLAELSSISAS